MYDQMSIFDFIEKPQEPERSEFITLLERLFGKIDDPVMQCGNCLCSRCVNNVEELWRRFRPEEVRESCFNCDECRYYTGNSSHRTQRKEDCSKFVISEYEAAKRRKKIKILE